MALINEKSSFNAQNGTAATTTTMMCNNQMPNFYSQTLLLNNRIDFKSEREFNDDSENNEDSDDFCLSLEKLKNKYNVLQPSTDSDIKRPYINGYSSSIKIKMPSNNTNSAASSSPGPKQNILTANCFDGVELGEPKCILYPKENICLEWKKFSKIGAGLCNIGNTCFMNSVLQSLTYCPPLVNYLFSIKDEHPAKCKNRIQFCMICLMIKHVTLVLNGQNSVIKPIYICQRLKSIAKHFTFGRQEDAHEFLRYVIDHMWRSCVAYHEQELGIPGLISKQTSDPLSKSTTAINHIFGGYCRSQVSCLQCKAKSNTYDYIMDFMLDIQNVSSLEEALRNFITPEILKNDNAYKCLKCKKSVSARKQFNVYRAPNVATFQFKRFDCNRMFGKIVKCISYPETLDLRPYMSENGPPLMYKLISVLVHHGNTCNSGHYYCYVKNSNKSWYMMNDSTVQQVGLNEVLNQKAYILFYIRQTDDNHTIKMNNNSLSSLKTNLNQNQTMPKIQSNKPKSDNSLTQNNDISNNRIFNSNFKFNLKPKQLQSTVVAHTSNQRSSLDENNNSLKYNGNNNHHNHHHSKENARPNSATIINDTVGSSKQSTTTLVLQNSKINNIKKEPLVPYENHDDDDDNENENVDSNSLTKHTPNRINESIREKTINTAIPKMKFLATSNSWRVVETSSIQSSNGLNNNESSNQQDKNNEIENNRKKPEANSNWKVIKTAITSEPSNNIVLNGIKRKHQDCDDEEYNHHDSKSDMKTAHTDDNKKSKKEKKKKRKKEKSKKRKRYDGSDMENDDEDDDVELNWVERTKETLEMENHTNTNAVEEDHHQTNNQKAKLVETSTNRNGDSSQKTDIIDALLKNASNGYGEVKSWNGGVSNLYKAMNNNDDDPHKLNDDHYNEEYDQGKVSKIKNRNSDNFELLKCGANNPFQTQQKARYSNGNNHNDMRNNSAHKPYHHHNYKNHTLPNGTSKNGSKSKFNFSVSKKSWNDNGNNNNFSSKKYYKNKSNNHHHNHRNHKSAINFNNSYDFKSR